MTKSKSNTLQGVTALVKQASELIQTSRQFAVRQTNRVMVFTYFHIGRLIVQHEQKGNEKAEYGKATISQLSAKLSAKFGNGFSERDMESFITYSPRPAAIKQGKLQKTQPLAAKLVSDVFSLSWSHYIILFRIENTGERSFYEIESLRNNWGRRELQRQLDSALFGRLALSKNKKKFKYLAARGQIIEKPEDVVKEPGYLEFLGLDERAGYTETELETAVIT